MERLGRSSGWQQRWQRRWLMLAALCLSGAVGACGVGFDSKSGGDNSRSKAAELKLDTPHDDRLSAEEGDNTDWKVINLEEPAAVTVKIYWDSPNGLDATLLMVSQFDEVKAQLRHNDGQREELAGPVVLDAGAWFIRVQINGGATVYTLEVSQSAAGRASGDRPEF